MDQEEIERDARDQRFHDDLAGGKPVQALSPPLTGVCSWQANLNQKNLKARKRPPIVSRLLVKGLTTALVLREHGDDALTASQSRANALWDQADDYGAAVWMRIARAVEELQRCEPVAGEAKH